MTRAEPPLSPADDCLARLTTACQALVSRAISPRHAQSAGRVITSLLPGAIGGYFAHVHWPSRLTADGFPLEVSLSLAKGAPPAFRYLLDLSDQRSDLSGNWPGLLTAAESLIPGRSAKLHDLFTSSLEGIDANSRTPVNHGCGFWADGRRRSSLYFFLGGSRARSFEARFPRAATRIDSDLSLAGGHRPARIHSVSYDFDEHGKKTRAKFYGWLRLPDERSVSDYTGHHADLRPGTDLTTVLASLGSMRAKESAVLLQSSLTGSAACRHKLYVNLPGWNVDPKQALLHSILFAATKLDLNLEPLESLLDCFRASALPVRSSWISAGPGAGMTWYFVPDFLPVSGWSLAGLTAAYSRGVSYLLSCRRSGMGWASGGPVERDAILSARIAFLLADDPSLHQTLAGTARWLRSPEVQSRCREGSERAVLTALTIHKLGMPAMNVGGLEWARATPRFLALGAHWASCRGARFEADALLDAALNLELPTGGWSLAGDELMGTGTVVDSLLACGLKDRPRVVSALSRASYVFADRPVTRDAVRVAAWLKGWIQCGLGVDAPSIQRALAYLASSQLQDGRWLSSPAPGATAANSDLDRDSMLSTATVLAALRLLIGNPSPSPLLS